MAAHLLDELSSASRDGRLRAAAVDYTPPGVLVVDEVGCLSHGAGGYISSRHRFRLKIGKAQMLMGAADLPLAEAFPCPDAGSGGYWAASRS